jgi:hypothetical protein
VTYLGAVRPGSLIRTARHGRAMFAWIAICFAVSAMGLGARHGCGAQSQAAERLAHHHGGPAEDAPTPPPATCDCVGHACCHAPGAAPWPGIAAVASAEAIVSPAHRPYHVPSFVTPRLLPYATAPPPAPAA